MSKKGQLELWLADTSIRFYRRRDGTASVRLRSFLMIRSDVDFSLAAYLRDISVDLETASGATVVFDTVSHTETCSYAMGVMAYGLWASGVGTIDAAGSRIGRLGLNYHLSFTGHPYERPRRLEVLVPILNRT